MKYILIVAFVCGTVLVAQHPKTAVGNNLRGIIGELSAGVRSGIAQRQLREMGDRTAQLVLDQYSLEDFANRETAGGIARAIELSFAQPDRIQKAGDKCPKYSAVVLAYLEKTHPEAGNRRAFQVADGLLARSVCK